MDNTLSVYFNVDKTYITLVERSKEGLKLKYLNSTDAPVVLENPDDPSSKEGIDQLDSIIENLKNDFQRISVTLPSESTFVTQFPGKENIKRSELEKMVKLEISQIYPQYNMKEFSITIVPFLKNKKDKQNMLAVILSKDIIKNTNEIFAKHGFDIDNMEISQLNAHSAFNYNYPELSDKTVALMSLQDKFIDISIIQNQLPVYYNLVSLSEPDNIGEVIEKEYNKITSNFTDSITSFYLFGSGLTKDLNMKCWETAMMLGAESKRLDPFRFLKTELDERDKEYCSRVFHLYPAPVGGCIPPKHERIKLA